MLTQTPGETLTTFSIEPPGVTLCGPGTSDELGGLVRSLGHERVFLVTDRGVVAAGVIGRITAHLTAMDIEVGTFHAVEPNPDVETLDAGQTWKPVAPLPEGFSVPQPGWFVNWAWDPKGDVFYASQMGKPTFRWER